MKMKKIPMMLLAAGMLAIGMMSCEKDNDNVKTSVAVTDSIKIPFMSNHYTLYSLSEGKVIPISDSATNKWDFGINLATIIVNGHASGPGEGGVIVETGNYETFTTAPSTGYSYDSTTSRLAINSMYGDPNAWYVYNENDPMHRFSSRAGLFFVFRTANGNYAKMEVLKVDYADFNPPSPYPNSIVYKFRYVYQSDGSLNLKE